MFYLICAAWAMQSIIAGVPLALIVPLARKRVHWESWELLALILPYGVLVALMVTNYRPDESILNLFESIFIGFGVVVAALVRVAVGKRVEERSCAVVLMFLLCVFAVILYFANPVMHDSM